MLQTKRNRSLSPYKENNDSIDNFYLSTPPNFIELSTQFPSFSKYVITNKYNYTTIDWKNPDAVRELTQCLLKKDFGLKSYNLPSNFLIPTIPSRLNYILFLKKLFNAFSIGNYCNSPFIVDIGTGANVIYPIIGNRMFNWNFVCSEINDDSIKIANEILKENQIDKIVILKQYNKSKVFEGILDDTKNIKKRNRKYIFTMCNPPYFDSEKEEKKDNKHTDNEYNFEEVYCKGGETRFILEMIKESEIYKNKVFIFTTLVGKKINFIHLKDILKNNEKIKLLKCETFLQGKNARWVLAWSYFDSYENFMVESALWIDKDYINYKPKIVKVKRNICKLNEI